MYNNYYYIYLYSHRAEGFTFRDTGPHLVSKHHHVTASRRMHMKLNKLLRPSRCLRWSVYFGCLINTSATIFAGFYSQILFYRYYFHHYNSLLLYFSHYIVTRGSVYRRGIGLEMAFFENSNTRLVTRINYSSIVDPHNLQITRVHTKFFQPAMSSLATQH